MTVAASRPAAHQNNVVSRNDGSEFVAAALSLSFSSWWLDDLVVAKTGLGSARREPLMAVVIPAPSWTAD